MLAPPNNQQRLAVENADLRARLEEAEEALRAIRSGEVDALMVDGPSGPRIFTLQGLDAESNRFRGDILAQISDAVVCVDEEGRVTYLNRAAERQYGLELGNALGQPVRTLWTERWVRETDEAASTKSLAETDAWRGENIHVTRSGREIHVESAVIRLRDAEGQSVGLLATIRDITERKRMEENLGRWQRALAENERRLRLATAAAGLGIWLWEPEKDRAVWENEQPYEILGLPRAAAPLTVAQFVAEFVHPEDRAAFQHAFLKDTPAGAALPFQCRFHRADGELRWIELTGKPLPRDPGEPLCVLGTIRDITEEKRAEAALRLNAALFSKIIEQAPGGVYVVDHQFRLQAVNAEALPVFASVQPLIGRYLDEVMHILWGPEIGAQCAAIFRHTLTTGERFVSPRFSEIRQDTGVEQAFEWETQRITLPEGRYGVVCYFTDVTARLRSEAELQRAKDVAEAANASKDRFLAVLSHELRTPLTPVLMTVAALEHDPTLPPAVREEMAMIKRNIALETKLIDDLLDVSRIISGKVTLKPEPVDLNDAVRQACVVCQPQSNEQGVAIKLALSEARLIVKADAARLQQVLWNVLKNAIKFTSAPGTVHVSTTRLPAERVEVRVCDQGVGIPPEMLTRIFEAFEQGDRNVTRQFGGLGLGLAISKTLLELHGGTIRAESEGPGRGATFVIELPEERTAPPTAPTLIPSNGALRQGRLLVVEDHPNTARTLRILLSHSGYTLSIAHDMHTALDLARKKTFDLLITDIGLPDGTGYDLLAALGKIQPLPAIVMSGYGMEEDLRRSREAGVAEHIVKPFDIPQLLAAIERITKAKSP